MLDDALLADLRADLAAELYDTVALWSDTGTVVQDDEPPFGTVDVWKLEGEYGATINPERNASRRADEGGSPTFLRTFHVTVPYDVEAEVGWFVEVVVSRDPRTQGRVLTVRDVQHGTQSISRRLVCQDNLTTPSFVPEMEGS